MLTGNNFFMDANKLACGVVLFTTLLSCADRRPGDQVDANFIVEKKFEAMNKHDLEALGNLYSDSAHIQSTGFEPTEIGPQGIKGVYTRYFASTPDLKFEVIRTTINSESIVIEYTSSGTMQQSPLEAVVPAYMIGKPYTLKNCTRIDVKDGKIVAEMTYFDQLAFLRQMGFFDQK
jgi:steroid delta-isomerase-like uncharacterized protein